MCPSNHELNNDRTKCVNIYPCKGLSMNETCICPTGLKLSPENTCLDIDECEEMDTCPFDSDCYNFFTGYKCISTECPEGYESHPFREK